jgi:hypothetical protein
MICETLGKPLAMTFDYEISTTLDTDQDAGKAAILTQVRAEDDGTSWVVVTDSDKPFDTGAKVYYAGFVNVGAEFTASAAIAGSSFGSATYVHFFDDYSGSGSLGQTLLQSITYHTSCSQPINLGDQVGNATLVGYVGENGSIDPNVWFGVDADDAPGPQAKIATTVTFNYLVTNDGTTPLSGVAVTDNVLGTPTYVSGDDGDNLLEAGEKWLYRATETAKEGLQTNTATAMATGAGINVSDTDAANYTGVPKPKFFVVDKGDDASYQYTAGGIGLGSFALTNSEARDVAANADGSRLWVLDKNKNVYVHDGDGNLLSTWKADSQGSEPEGITLDPSVDPQTGKNDLWIADRDRKIRWYDDAASNTSVTGTDTAEGTFTPSMSGNLKGIVTDGTSLWAVTEGSTDYVYRFGISRDHVTGNPTGLQQNGLWKLNSLNSKPTGITLDPAGGTKLWIVDESTDTVYEYGNGRTLTSGTGAVSSSFKLAGTNLDPQGIADPLAWGGSSDASTLNLFAGAANSWAI